MRLRSILFLVNGIALIAFLVMAITGPWRTRPVLIVTWPPETSAGKRSSPRGAGPPFFSPTRLYFEPWHGHSNH